MSNNESPPSTLKHLKIKYGNTLYNNFNIIDNMLLIIFHWKQYYINLILKKWRKIQLIKYIRNTKIYSFIKMSNEVDKNQKFEIKYKMPIVHE